MNWIKKKWLMISLNYFVKKHLNWLWKINSLKQFTNIIISIFKGKTMKINLFELQMLKFQQNLA